MTDNPKPSQIVTNGFGFVVSGPRGARVVRVEKTLARLPGGRRLVLRSSASRPARLVPDDFPDRLAINIDGRLQARDGQRKGRVLMIWLDEDGRPARPLAVCAWHVHEGHWPLAILDAGVANAVEDDGFGWPQRDGLKWPHFALVDVLVR